MSGSCKDSYGSSGTQEENIKEGLCLLELRRVGMVQWGVCGQVSLADKFEGNNAQILSSAVKEEQKDDEEDLTVASGLSPQIQKRKGPSHWKVKEAKAARCLKQKKTSMHKQIKHENSIAGQKESLVSKKKDFIDRWSIDRYKLAETHMLEVMKAKEAVFDNPISRPVLRVAARKYIPDTGLLDHLLKHIDGKVAPGGTERFRRCYNTAGVMEYWLESADLIKVKPESGMLDTNYVPPSCWRPGSAAIRPSVSTEELILLKEEIAKLKRDMDELSSKNKEQNQVNPIEEIAELQEMLKELVKWRSKTDQRLIEISSSLSGMQDMCRELTVWKCKTEQKLTEISNLVNSTQASKQITTTLSPVSERWEDWLEGTNLDNIQAEDFAPWIGSSDLVNAGKEARIQQCSAPLSSMKPCDSTPSQENICARDLELLKEEMDRVKRDVQDLLPKRMEDAQASVTPDSSATTNNYKLDLDNPFLLFQEMFKELMKWKAKMEEQMLEISNAVSYLQASKQYTF